MKPFDGNIDDVYYTKFLKTNYTCIYCKKELNGFGDFITHNCEQEKENPTNMKNQVTKLFFDCEFTGLHQNTTLVSIGLISDKGHHFYAELYDYDKSQIDDWLQVHVINNLKFKEPAEGEDRYGVFSRHFDNSVGESLYDSYSVDIQLNKNQLRTELERWLSQFEKVQMIGDCLSYDWVLFCEIFGGARFLPKHVYYIPDDIAIMFGKNKLTNYDMDFNRETLVSLEGLYVKVIDDISMMTNPVHKINDFLMQKLSKYDSKHNALYDAFVIKRCYEILS